MIYSVRYIQTEFIYCRGHREPSEGRRLLRRVPKDVGRRGGGDGQGNSQAGAQLPEEPAQPLHGKATEYAEREGALFDIFFCILGHSERDPSGGGGRARGLKIIVSVNVESWMSCSFVLQRKHKPIPERPGKFRLKSSVFKGLIMGDASNFVNWK